MTQYINKVVMKKYIILSLFVFVIASCVNAQTNKICNLIKTFEKISQLDGFQLLHYTAEEYGYPKEMGKMKMACYKNSDPREEVLAILKKFPNSSLKVNYIDDRGKMTRYYLEKDNNGKAFLLQTFIGTGGNDLCICLFSGATHEYYNTIIQQIKIELKE